MVVSIYKGQAPIGQVGGSTDFTSQIISPAKNPALIQSVYQLVAGNLAFVGEVSPDKALATARDDLFDNSQFTKIISIHHESGRLAGTVSVTSDSDDGMPISNYFRQELKFIRRKYRLVNCWRFSLSALFQCQELRALATTCFKDALIESEADAFVLYFNQKLTRYYSRFFIGRVIASKEITFDGVNFLPVQLMLCLTKDNLIDPTKEYRGHNNGDTVGV